MGAINIVLSEHINKCNHLYTNSIDCLEQILLILIEIEHTSKLIKKYKENKRIKNFNKIKSDSTKVRDKCQSIINNC